MDVADLQIGTAQVLDTVGDRCQKLFQDFLEDFGEDVSGEKQLKYLEDARNLIKPERNTLNVSFADVQEYNQQLATVITEEYYRVYPFLCRAVRNFVKDQADINLPHKEYYLSLTDIPTRIKVRELSTAKVGTLIRISGQVVRTHPVHPELTSGTFSCLDCQTVIKDVEQQFKYTQPSICTNSACQNKSRFILETSKSRFVDFQKIRIQETQAELPRGAIPRSLEVVVRAEAVELAQAGDRCDFIGTLIVVPDVGALNLAGARAESGGRNRAEGGDDNEGIQGLKELGVRELHYRLAFLACSVFPTNAKYGKSRGEWEVDEVTAESLKKQMSDDEWSKLFTMVNDKHLYANLTNSLFPTIHGNDEIKKGILLMLLGGVPKTTMEGTSLRGDINVCIVGDPSTAKSQFLKQVSDFAPRAVYTSGKASSASGLTAAVVRDEETYEFVIEAGALMLADNGVCCIDEFDKMDPRDQVAIHEAMEQQTISITKAGIKATLNARTSILAAANPSGGRYDRGQSLKKNINMGAPIMSRFDLFFILIDDINEVTDYAIARKITDLHSRLATSVERTYTEDEVRRYIMFARQFKPQISKEASVLLIQYYKSLRQRDAGSASRNSWRITVRQLESMIRLSEAMARLYCTELVEKMHVQEAYRLLNKSIIRVEQADIELDAGDSAPVVENDIEEEDAEDISRQVDMSMDEDHEPIAMDDSSIHPSISAGRSGRGSEFGTEGEGGEASSDGKKRKLKLSYDEYKSMSNVILLHMRREEIRLDEEGVETGGLRRSDVVNWYLALIGEEIANEAELVQKKELVEKVIDRLISVDNLIIPLARTGLVGHDLEEEDSYLVVHPNHDIQLS